MSTVKISQLSELTSADASDLLLITDSSASESKKIQKSNITQENFTTTLKNKLDGIEASATADQTAQEIATAIDADTTAESTLKSALGLGSAAYTASTAYATSSQGSKADTAHGWGNHASEGYIKDNFSVTAGTLTTANITTADFGGYTVAESTGTLTFATGGSTKMTLDSSGVLTIA